MIRNVGPQFRAAASRLPVNVIDQRARRYGDELNRAQPPLTVAAYSDLESRGPKKFFDAERCECERNGGRYSFHDDVGSGRRL